MNNHLFPSLILHSIISILCILIYIPSSYSYYDDQYGTCGRPYACGEHIKDIWYPFWGDNIRPHYCGRQGFELKCHDNHNTTIQFGDQNFRVLSVNMLQQKMIIAQDDLFRSPCPAAIMSREIFIKHPQISYGQNIGYFNLFFNCSGELSSVGQNNFSCPAEREEITGFYTIDGESRLQNRSNSCNRVLRVPFQQTDPPLGTNDLLAGRLSEALQRGFEVQYSVDNESCTKCMSSFGICGSNQFSDQFTCICRDHKTHSLTCPNSGSSPRFKLKHGIGIFAALLGMTIIICIIVCNYKWKKISSILLKTCCGRISKTDKDIEAFIRHYGPLATKRYIYSDVKKMTNSFKDKLGQGGYGSVYKGKLPDGRLVAVKLLNTSKGNGQEFINEVASIGRTSHVNVVTLLGYCLEDSKRALIYEFMPNGSLEKFIYNGETTKPSQHLRWEKMYEIITGIARGLEYLHRGCNTRILHFDIKPHNILLDEDFCPKISDFGLAKLCPKKESIVSMLEARGTIGYIAPEVFSRNFGNVSHKSDVYSYGMMVLEMVGCRKNLEAGESNSSELYFPDWIYRHVEQGREFEWPGVVTSEENEIAKKMIIVGLWCIQTRPSDRPSINTAIEMLQGSVEALEIPPMPFVSSPPGPPIYSSTTSLS
ncbi:Receptor-like kinase [Melia azedarach]|uniref:Receptor-like kinase n=1 Tax=Melia azedarach TaxID=155640 RepID=A0ACC1XR86_MELAZ|nr:Receptor-like kinase [Melia azedarach]